MYRPTPMTMHRLVNEHFLLLSLFRKSSKQICNQAKYDARRTYVRFDDKIVESFDVEATKDRRNFTLRRRFIHKHQHTYRQ